MRSLLVLGAVAVASLAFGCAGEATTEGASSSARSSAFAGAPSLASLGATSFAASASPTQANSAQVAAAPTSQAIVKIPEGRTPEPTTIEWEGAPTFNTNTSGLRDERCPIAFVREWVRFSCKGGPFLLPSRVSMKAGSDYWLRGVANDTFIGRLAPGAFIEFSAYLGEADRPVIRVVWPSGQPGPTVAEAIKDPGGPLAVHPREVKPIPDFGPPGPRPLAGDWQDATAVNTGTPARWPKSCEALVLRGWLRWHCSGPFLFLRNTEGFGKLGKEHFLTNTSNLMAGEVQLVSGMRALARVQFDLDGPTAELRIHWPVNEPKPSEISIQTASQ
jgi:hypothetical protein